MDGVEAAEGLSGSVLLIGFGRFGQVVSQPLLARGFELSIIETDTQAIRDAEDFGFKVYYGDGSRLDILHAAGAGEAQLIVWAADDRERALRFAEIARAEFPLTPTLVRAFDREHACELVHAGATFQIREVLVSAMAVAEEALRRLGLAPEEVAEAMDDYRREDAARFESELVGGLDAGRGFLHGNLPGAKAP